jgi:uncharacterized membrane protein
MTDTARADDEAADVVGARRRWPVATSLGLCIAGLVISAYLTYEHYSESTTLACPGTGTIDCAKVTSSTYADVLGVPVAVLGLLYFVGMTALCLPAAWRPGRPLLARARLAGVTAGVGFVVYLVWAELFRIDAICLWCTAVHVVTGALFAVVVLAAALEEPA